MILRFLLSVSALIVLSACSPEVGSEAWCEDLKEKDKGAWTLDESAAYAKSCIF